MNFFLLSQPESFDAFFKKKSSKLDHVAVVLNFVYYFKQQKQ